MRIGVIADTQRLIRPEALAALRGVDHILHAGDIRGDLSSRAPLRLRLASLDVAQGRLRARGILFALAQGILRRLRGSG